jgi:hypothetical protein
MIRIPSRVQGFRAEYGRDINRSRGFMLFPGYLSKATFITTIK